MKKKAKGYYNRIENFFDENRKKDPNLKELDSFLKNKIDINCRKGGNVLHVAVGKSSAKKRLEHIQFLLKNQVKVNARDNAQWTPLHVACRNRNIELEVVKYLVDEGANVDALDSLGRTPIFFAVEFLDVKIVEFLCSTGLDFNHTEINGDTPLHWSCEKQRLSVVKHLLFLKAQFIDNFAKKNAIFYLTKENKTSFFNHLDGLLGKSDFLNYVQKRTVNEGSKKDQKRMAQNKSYSRYRVEGFDTFMSEIKLREELRFKYANRIGENNEIQLEKIDILRENRLKIFEVLATQTKFKQEIRDVISLKIRIEKHEYNIFDKISKERSKVYKNLLPVSQIDLKSGKNLEKGFFGHCSYLNTHFDSFHLDGSRNYAVCVKEFKLLNSQYLKKYYKVITQIVHPNLVNCYGLIINQNDNKLVSEFCSKNLFHYVQAKEGTVLDDLKVLLNISKGLHYLYKCGMHHGNLKIKNVIFAENSRDPNHVKLTDFYLIKNYKSSSFNCQTVYKSPEQVNNNLFESILKTEIYAFGILSYCIVFKKLEDDLFHRLKKNKRELLDFIHTHLIRPLLRGFPVELEIELRQQYKLNYSKLFSRVLGLLSSKRLKDSIKDVNNLITTELVLYREKPKILKKVLKDTQQRLESILKRRKKTKQRIISDEEKGKIQRCWDDVFLRYFNSELLSMFKNEYTKKVNDLNSSPITFNDDVRHFVALVNKIFTNSKTNRLCEYFEVLWKDVCYCKEIWKKLPKKFIDLMKRCFSQKPRNRPRDFNEISKTLENIILAKEKKLKSNFTPSVLKQLLKSAEEEKKEIKNSLREIKEKEIQNHIDFDLNEEVIKSFNIGKAAKTNILIQIQNEMEKLKRAKEVCEKDLKNIDDQKMDAQKKTKFLLGKRKQLTQQRRLLNNREKEVVQKAIDYEEKKKMVQMMGGKGK